MAESKRKTGRPAKGTARTFGERPKRGSVGGFREKLNILNEDPDFNYRWFMDRNGSGNRIREAIEMGYEMVNAEDHDYGNYFVYKAESGTSVVRCPADNEGNFLYLMRIPKVWAEEIKAEKAKEILDIEKKKLGEFGGSKDAEGTYGGIKINYGKD